MNKRKIFLIAIVMIFIFFLVYQPHWGYPYPIHIDEWHHASESIRLGNYGEYFEVLRDQAKDRFMGLEIGFHFLLFLFSFVVNILKAYKFLPAIWAVLAGLTLFIVTYKKTNRNFAIAILAMIFFASIKSNVNIMGLWFFTPMTFVIPLIFLYIYLLTDGIEKENRKMILFGLGIIILLIPFHSISISFALPALIIFALVNIKYIIQEIKIFLLFLIIPIVGIFFIKYIMDIPWIEMAGKMLELIQFKYGWGVLEIKNSLTEIYSWIGYILAIAGVIAIVANNNLKKYAIYLLWPATLILMIIIYRMFGVSYLSPYQRNFYYLAISLPFLSAIGLYSIIKIATDWIEKIMVRADYTKDVQSFAKVSINIKIDNKYTKYIKAGAGTVILIIVLLLTFNGYYDIPKQVDINYIIDQKDYQDLEFLATQPPGKVMATPFVGTAVYPVARKEVVATVFFQGDRRNVEIFFLTEDCDIKREVIDAHQIRYIISPVILTCDFELIYHEDNNFIYRID